MDQEKIILALRHTLEHDHREHAEEILKQMQKIITFTPVLLQILEIETVDMPVRQAAAIYLKNTITLSWNASPDFMIHEQDREVIRQRIIPAIIVVPEVIRVQLAVCVQHILKYDFPEKWPLVIDTVLQQLNTTSGHAWLGALTVVYKLVKNYEYKKPEERKPVIEAMQVVLPVLYERMQQLLPDSSQESVLLQKLMLKIFFALVQHSLSLEMLSKEQFGRWMEIVRHVVDRPVPDETNAVDEDERPDLVWWKCKKWAMHLLHRIFDRYGSPGNVANDYKEFANYYLKTYSQAVIETVLKMLSQHRLGTYVSPRVLHEALMYLSKGTQQAFSWKFIKPHINGIVREILFPLMCHNAKDQELWDDDPQEFIRIKYDIFEELINPVHAADELLNQAMKRKDVLAQTIQFIVQMLNSPEATVEQKDGALHMVGTLAPTLLKKKIYRNELESLLVNHVFPLFKCDKGFLRARACWCVREFAEIPFKVDENLQKALELCTNALLTDPDLPVQMEAAMAVQMLITEHQKAAKLLEPNVKVVIMQLLELIAKTENEDLCTVMQKFIEEYMEHLIPIAVEAAQKLAAIFNQLLSNEDDGDSDGRALTAMGILNSLEAILNIMEDHSEIMVHLEQIVLNIIGTVIQHNVMDFYEEMLSLVYSLICVRISPTMWQVFDALYDMFGNDGIEYFTDMMPALHNYLTVDTPALLAEPQRFDKMIAICEKVLQSDLDEDSQGHAAKLLECIILQCKDHIGPYIHHLLEIAFNRLGKPIETSELRTMCLQIVIATIFINPTYTLNTIRAMQPPQAQVSLLNFFINQWLDDTDCFLGFHDRKMCVLGLSSVISVQEGRPEVLADPNVVKQIIPACILLLDGLQKAYEAKSKTEKSSEGSESDGEGDDGPDDVDEGVLESDEDAEDSDQEYMDQLLKADKDSGNAEDYEDDEDDDFGDETELETYETPLDDKKSTTNEFLLFKEILQGLEINEPQWYQALVSGLSNEQILKLQKIFTVAEQRRAALESQKIQEQGGYAFNVQNIPQNFNFGN